MKHLHRENPFIPLRGLPALARREVAKHRITLLRLVFLGLPGGIFWLAGMLIIAGSCSAAWIAKGSIDKAIWIFSSLGAAGAAVGILGWLMMFASVLGSRNKGYRMDANRLATGVALDSAVFLLCAVATGCLVAACDRWANPWDVEKGWVPALVWLVLCAVALRVQWHSSLRRQQRRAEFPMEESRG